jgi:hypothetical protein
MQEIRVSKGIKRISIPQAGAGMAMIVYKAKGKKKKKQSFGLKAFDKLLRRSAKAQQTFASEYRDRHDRSNRKKRDGWFRDLSWNLSRSGDKARKKSKMNRLLVMRY